MELRHLRYFVAIADAGSLTVVAERNVHMSRTFVERNFDGYTPPYIKNAPVAVDVHIVPNTEKPSGCGEPPLPVIAPAVVNAFAKLTGNSRNLE